jgi:hypothetical protein
MNFIKRVLRFLWNETVFSDPKFYITKCAEPERVFPSWDEEYAKNYKHSNPKSK